MIQIVFENAHFVICDKAAGVLSTPSRFEGDDKRFCLGLELQKQLGVQIYPVNRLDFEVSGLVVYAKTADGHRAANSWFEKKEVSKTYRALTTGQSFAHIPAQVQNPRVEIQLEPGLKLEWTSRILRGKRRAYESPQGKDCLTRAQYLGRSAKGFHKWDLNPVTGRAHQLRFDLSRHGFPIVGDRLYGSEEPFGADSIALRSYKLDFSKAPRAHALGLPEVLEVSLHMFD